MAEDAGDLSGVDAATLEPIVRDLLGEPAAVLEGGWSCRPLGGGGGEGLGLYRVTGSARVGGASHPWALVLKVGADGEGADPSAWDFPAREGLAYGSALPGRRDAARRDDPTLARGGRRRAPRPVAARPLRPRRPAPRPLQRRLPGRGASA
jgi:hypothetical protein